MSFATEIQFLLKHSSIYGIGTILSKAVSFLLLPLYTQYLTPQDYGILELINVTTNTFGVVIGLGISQAMTRFFFVYSEEIDRNCVVSTIYLLALIVEGVGLLFVGIESDLLAKWILDSGAYAHHFMVGFLALLLGLIIDLGQTYLRLIYKPLLYTCISLITLVGGVFFSVLFIVFMNYGVLGAIYSNFFTMLLVAIPLTGGILYRVGIGFKWGFAREILKYSALLLPAELAHTAVNYSDRYFIKYYVSIADAGIYGLANKIGTSIHMLITSPFLSTFLPRRFEIAQADSGPQVLAKIFDFYFMGFVFIGLALAVFVDEIMRVMTTPEYYKAGAYVPMIVLTMLILGMKYHFELGVLYGMKTQLYSYVNVFTAIVHVLLNVVLVDRYGVWGAIYSSLVAVSLTTFLIYWVSWDLYPIKYDFLKNAKIFMMALIIFALSRVEVTDIPLLQVGYKMIVIAVYPAFLILVGIVSPVEIAHVKELCGNIFRRGEA